MRSRLGRMSIVLLALVAWSCGAARPSKYYSLDMPSSTSLSGAPIAADLLIGRFSAPHILRDDRIVYRYGSTQLGAYDYHRWAEPPADMVEALFLRTLRNTGRYRSVAAQGSNSSGDFILRGRIQEFGEVSEPVLGARVVMDVELIEKSTGRAVWTDMFDKTEPVNGKEVPDVVAALNRVAQQAVEKFAAGVGTYFSQHPPK